MAPLFRTAALALLGAAAFALPSSTQEIVNGKPVYCWQGNAEVNITQQTAEGVCADVWIISPPNNPISEYWETRLTIEGIVLKNDTITNIWRFDPVPGSAAMDTSVIAQYKLRSWDQLEPEKPFKAVSFCGLINWSHYGFTTSKTVISSNGGRICDTACAAPLNKDFGSGCVWGNWSDSDCSCKCNAGFCANTVTGQCTIQQAWDSLANKPQSCSIGMGVQLDPNGQPVSNTAVPVPLPVTLSVKPSATAAGSPATAAAATSTKAGTPASATQAASAASSTGSGTNTASQTSPAIIVVTTPTAQPEVSSKGLSTAAIGGMIGAAVAVAAILVGFVLWRRVSSNPAAKTLSSKKEAGLEEGSNGGKSGDSLPSSINRNVTPSKSSKVVPDGTTLISPDASVMSSSSVVTMSRAPASPVAAASPVVYSPLYQTSPPNSNNDARMSGAVYMDSGDANLMTGQSLIASEGALGTLGSPASPR